MVTLASNCSRGNAQFSFSASCLARSWRQSAVSLSLLCAQRTGLKSALLPAAQRARAQAKARAGRSAATQSRWLGAKRRKCITGCALGGAPQRLCCGERAEGRCDDWQAACCLLRVERVEARRASAHIRQSGRLRRLRRRRRRRRAGRWLTGPVIVVLGPS